MKFLFSLFLVFQLGLISSSLALNLGNNLGNCVDRDDLHNQLIKAVSENSIIAVKMILSDCADKEAFVNRFTPERSTALIIAIANKNLELVDIILNAGADVNLNSNKTSPPLFYAIAQGDLDLIIKLINEGADVKIINPEDGNSSIQYAILSRYLSNNNLVRLLQILVDAGLDLNANNDEFPVLIKTLQSRERPFFLVKKLLELGVDAKHVDIDQRSALFYVPRNDVRVAEVLIAAGVPLESTDVYGLNPLIFAVNNYSEQVVHFFLSKGVNPNFTDRNLSTPLMYIANLEISYSCWGSCDEHIVKQNSQLYIIATLIKYGAKINAVNIAGQTAFGFYEKATKKAKAKKVLNKKTIKKLLQP